MMLMMMMMMVMMIVCWRGVGIFRAFHKLFEIVQNVFRNFSKSCLKVAKKQSRVMKVARLKAVRKNKNFYGLMLKYANCTTKENF